MSRPTSHTDADTPDPRRREKSRSCPRSFLSGTAVLGAMLACGAGARGLAAAIQPFKAGDSVTVRVRTEDDKTWLFTITKSASPVTAGK